MHTIAYDLDKIHINIHFVMCSSSVHINSAASLDDVAHPIVAAVTTHCHRNCTQKESQSFPRLWCRPCAMASQPPVWVQTVWMNGERTCRRGVERHQSWAETSEVTIRHPMRSRTCGRGGFDWNKRPQTESWILHHSKYHQINQILCNRVIDQ